MIEKTLIVMDSDCRIGFAAFSDNPVNPVILSKKATPGFTLAEILVALAIFGILMAAVVIIFVGSLRTTQTGYQQMDAFERARTALSVIDDDLVRGYASHQSGDVHSFYGTPIGMTFVGVVQMTSESKDVNQARITYVVYNQEMKGMEEFPIIDESTGEVTGYPYPLLRYVEPGVGDLDSFPVIWEQDYDGFIPSEELQRLCDQTADQDPNVQRFNWADANLEPRQQDIVRAMKCEVWIRMLAGGDRLVSLNYWQRILDADFQDYIVTENVISTAKPYDHSRAVVVPLGDDRYDRGDGPFALTPFFDYQTYSYPLEGQAGNASLSGSPWWNDPRASKSNWREPRLPEVVMAKFLLMFPSPYPGAPDFQRLFTLEVNLPVGYTRTANP